MERDALECSMLATTFRLLKQLALLAVMFAAWGLLLVVGLEWVPGPIRAVEEWLMPWRLLFQVPIEFSFEERLVYMEDLLRHSVVVANLGIAMMVVSALVLSAYATFVYQQRQRRVHENEMLQLKNLEIARRNEFIRYISATISHEFKNNLGRIKRRLDLMDVEGPEVERIRANMEKLFADIEIFKKISDEREAGLIEFERTDLREMLRQMAAQYSDLADVRFESADGVPVIFAARTLLRTVIESILDNAVKYKKPEQHRAQVTLICGRDTDGPRTYVTLTVRDEGMGMDEQKADLCFYERVQSGAGWGEGLYFAKYVVGLHAGKIRVGKEYTRPGTGTEIIIKLPHVEEDARRV